MQTKPEIQTIKYGAADDVGIHYVIVVSRFEVDSRMGAVATSEVIEAGSDRMQALEQSRRIFREGGVAVRRVEVVEIWSGRADDRDRETFSDEPTFCFAESR